jgi:hypothetical protein
MAPLGPEADGICELPVLSETGSMREASIKASEIRDAFGVPNHM